MDDLNFGWDEKGSVNDPVVKILKQLSACLIQKEKLGIVPDLDSSITFDYKGRKLKFDYSVKVDEI